MTDIYNNVMLRRWSLDLATGRQECVEDAINITTISAVDRAAIEAKNAVVHDAIEAVEAYEAASDDDVAELVKALARLRAGEADEGDLALMATAWDYAVEITVGPQGDAVNVEREQRIAAGATVSVPGAGQIPVQGRPEDIRNLQGIGMAALARMMLGDTTPTDFRDADNVNHLLNPQQTFALWQGAAGYVSAVISASWALKAMTPIPADFTDDSYWPAKV